MSQKTKKKNYKSKKKNYKSKKKNYTKTKKMRGGGCTAEGVEPREYTCGSF